MSFISSKAYNCSSRFIWCASLELARSTFSTSSSSAPKTSAPPGKHYKLLILGGGTGGCSVASRLTGTMSPNEMAVVEPSDIHYYQPLWTLVGAGIRSFEESHRPMQKVLPSNITWIKDEVTKLEPQSNCVHLSKGECISYDYLVIALGMTLRFDLVKGAQQALDNDPRVSSNYDIRYLPKTWKNYQSFSGGRAVFTLPNGPIKCAGAPQKVMYLFEDYLRKQNRRDTAEFHYFTSLAQMFSVDKYSQSLVDICRARNIHTNLRHHLIEVDMSKSEAVFENLDTKAQQVIKYDFLHITPPMSVPAVLKATPGLTNPEIADYVRVDKGTLRHETFPNVFALGDCAALPTSKTAAAVASQSAILQRNLVDVMNHGSGNVAIYDGYTSCPFVTRYNRGVLAEFDYSGKPLETTPLNQAHENYMFYFLKANIMPSLYWDWLIKGLWPGPKYVRKILHLGLSRR